MQKTSRRWVDALMPTLAMFGPLFIALGVDSASILSQAFSMAGALMVGFALLHVWRRQTRIEQRMEHHDGASGGIGAADGS
jgi:hypothetical protein